MPKKKAPPRAPVSRQKRAAKNPNAPTETVDWIALVESLRHETQGHDLARRLLEVGKTMTTGAGHMYLLGEYLLEKKKELAHGEFGPWIEEQGLAQRTARKYMAFTRRVDRWTHQNGMIVPFCALTALVQGERTNDSDPPESAKGRDATGVGSAIDAAPDLDVPEGAADAHELADGSDDQDISAAADETSDLGDDGSATPEEANEPASHSADTSATPEGSVEPCDESGTALSVEDRVSLVEALDQANQGLGYLGRMDIGAVETLDMEPLRGLAGEVGRLRSALRTAGEVVEALANAVRQRGLAFSHEPKETGS